MSTIAGTTRTLLQYIKPMIVVGFLALSLIVGAGASTNQVGAEAPQVSQLGTQSGVVIAPTAGEEPATKPGGGGTTTPPAKKKHTVCYIYSQEDFLKITGINSDVGGMICVKE